MSITVSVYARKLAEPKAVALRLLLWRFGTGCYPGKVEERKDDWIVPIEVYQPTRILDEKTGDEKTLTYHLPDVGTLRLRKSDLRLLGVSGAGTVRMMVRLKRAEYKRSVEHDLVKAARRKWGFCRRALQHMEPTYRAVGNLLREIHPTVEELEHMGYLEQIQLLEDLGYADIVEGRLDGTPKLNDLLRACRNDVETTAKTLVGLVIGDFYEHLTSDLRLNSFIPYVRIGASYYGDSVDFGKLIAISRDKLKRNLIEFYAGAPKVRFGLDVTIDECLDSGILHSEGQRIVGDPDIFNELLDVRQGLPLAEDILTQGL
jgi:hypothetical protein